MSCGGVLDGLRAVFFFVLDFVWRPSVYRNRCVFVLGGVGGFGLGWCLVVSSLCEVGGLGGVGGLGDILVGCIIMVGDGVCGGGAWFGFEVQVGVLGIWGFMWGVWVGYIYGVYCVG